jgi:hypothetical protein
MEKLTDETLSTRPAKARVSVMLSFYKQQLRHTLLFSFFFFLFTPYLQAESEFRIDLAYGGTWHDAEKSQNNKNDDWLCWASSAANILTWTQWGTEAGFQNEDEIFKYFTRHWNDHPAGSPREAWRWWFTGTSNDHGTAKVTKQGGGFWPNIEFSREKWNSRDGDIFRGIGQNQLQRDPYLLRHLLENGYGVVLQIIHPTTGGSRDSHMITLWGFRYSWTSRFQGILVTDSDDAKETNSAEQAANMMVYYPVKLKDGAWWFTYREQQWKILAAYALRHKNQYDKKNKHDGSRSFL